MGDRAARLIDILFLRFLSVFVSISSQPGFNSETMPVAHHARSLGTERTFPLHLAGIDRLLIILACMLTTYIVLRTTFVPVMYLSFFADDFAFLNWTARLDLTTWLTGFIEAGQFNNITYRPFAGVIYLVYLTGSDTFGYFLLASLFAINIGVLFFLYRRISNLPIAALSVLIFTGSFIYFDATHKIYNLITQASAAFFLTSVHDFLSADHSRERVPYAAYIFYALSLLTYEITLFGFAIFFVLALRRECAMATGQVRMKHAVIEAFKRSWVFVALSAIYLIANLLSPIKAAHLQDHAPLLNVGTIPTIFSRVWEVLKNTLAWIVAPVWAGAWRHILPIDFVILSIFLVTIIAILLVRSAVLEPVAKPEMTSEPFLWLCAFGGLWFVVLILPGAISSYFDYRMTFLAYAGFSLCIAACLSSIQHAVCKSSVGYSYVLRCSIAGVFGLIVTIWITCNLSLAESMNANLIQAANQQKQILTFLRPYLPAVPQDSVIAVRYDHNPSKSLPYPYMAAPFAEDYALADALKYYFGRQVSDANLFFRPGSHQFEIGRFNFARKLYLYDRLVLFDFYHECLSIQPSINLDGTEFVLPLTVKVAASSGGHECSYTSIAR